MRPIAGLEKVHTPWDALEFELGPPAGSEQVRPQQGALVIELWPPTSLEKVELCSSLCSHDKLQIERFNCGFGQRWMLSFALTWM